MRIDDALTNVAKVFLDSVVVIYYIENHPVHGSITQRVFQRLDQGSLIGITSPITLAECLVVPQRRGDAAIIDRFTDLIVAGAGVRFVRTDETIAKQASVLRSVYSIRLPDALQLATAIVAGCEVFLTNDARLKKVSEINIFVIDELTA